MSPDPSKMQLAQNGPWLAPFPVCWASQGKIPNYTYMRTALVTGSSRGIGLGLVEALVAKGYRVIASCRSPDTALRLKPILSKSLGQLEIIQMDVTDEISVREAAKVIKKTVESIDLLVNNAGLFRLSHRIP